MRKLPYRPEALREARSPERLDEAIQVTSPMSWLALVVIFAGVAGALSWAVFGSISTRIQGEGLITYEGSRRIDIVSRSEGYLTALRVRPGDRVVAGDVVARIENLAPGAAQRQPGGPASGVAPASAAVEVRAAVDGEIIEVLAGVGTLVHPGDRLYQMTNRVSTLAAVAFVASDDAERIEPGMIAHVSPRTISQREFGSLRGVVRTVSRHRLSADALQAMVGNAPLVERFSQSGMPLAVDIDLVRSPDGGFSWTTGRPPPRTVIPAPGMLATVHVTVREQRPLTLGIPALGRILGGE